MKGGQPLKPGREDGSAKGDGRRRRTPHVLSLLGVLRYVCGSSDRDRDPNGGAGAGGGAAAPGKVLRFKRLGSSAQVVVGHVCVYHVCVCGPGEVLEVVVGDEPGLEARVQDRRCNPARDAPH